MGEAMLNAMDALNIYLGSLPQEQRDEIDRRNEIMRRSGRFASNLRWYGCIDVVLSDGKSFDFVNTDFHVYLWKHIGGEIFYVGSGKGKRCYISRRGDFENELDSRDVIVYVLAYGLPVDEARTIESRVIYELSKAGQPLRNRMHNANSSRGGSVKKDWAKSSRLFGRYGIDDVLSRIARHDGEERYQLDEIQMLSDYGGFEGISYVLANDYRA